MTPERRLSSTVAAMAAMMMTTAAMACQGFSATIMCTLVRSPRMSMTMGSTMSVAKMTVRLNCSEPRCVEAVMRRESWRRALMTAS